MAYKVLVIDDMVAIYKAIRKVLEVKDCTVDYALSGHEGIEMAGQQTYDLIILDIHLPDTNGIDVCMTLKSTPTYVQRPIVLLTSDTRNLEAGLKAGASDYILKPFNELEMTARVFTQINISRYQLALALKTERLEREFNLQKEKLSEVQNDLQRYFYQTSHRLRSPLNSMKGLFNLMEIDCPEVKRNSYVSLLEEAVNRISHVNEQVSRIGHLRACRPAFKTSNLECFLRGLLNERNLLEKVHLQIDSSININTDEEILRYGLEPIIDNAIYYSQLGKQEATVQVSTQEITGSLLLMIHDSGPGFQKQTVDKAFDMFYVGDEKSKGNGLGLFISKIAMELLGINLKIQSAEGIYTKIIIDISGVKTNNQPDNENYRITA